MGATRIDGNACGAAVEAALAERIATLSTPPHLAVVIVGNDPASHVYVGAKERACARLGIRSTRIDIDADADYALDPDARPGRRSDQIRVLRTPQKASASPIA